MTFELIWKVGISCRVLPSDLIAKPSKPQCLFLPSTASVRLTGWKYGARWMAADPQLNLTRNLNIYTQTSLSEPSSSKKPGFFCDFCQLHLHKTPLLLTQEWIGFGNAM